VPGNKALDERIMRTYAALNVVGDRATVRSAQEHGKTFIPALVEGLQPAADRATLAYQTNALVVQHTDLILGAEASEREELAFNAFMAGMGAHVSRSDGYRQDVTSRELGALLQRQSSRQLMATTEAGAMGSANGSYVIAETDDGSGHLKPEGLLIETDVPGVRIWLDGPAITRYPESQGKGAIRPMLLVSTSNNAETAAPEDVVGSAT